MDIRHSQSSAIVSIKQLIQRVDQLTLVIDRTLSYPVNQPRMASRQQLLLTHQQRLVQLRRIYQDIYNNLQINTPHDSQTAKLNALIQKHEPELDTITADARDLLTALKHERATASTLSNIMNELDIKWKQLQSELNDSKEHILDLAADFAADSLTFQRLNQLYAAFAALSDAMANETAISKSLLGYYQSQSHILHRDLNEEIKLQSLEAAMIDIESAQALLNDHRINEIAIVFKNYLDDLRTTNGNQPIEIDAADYDLMIEKYKQVYAIIAESSRAKKQDSLIGVQHLIGLFEPPKTKRTIQDNDAPVDSLKRSPQKR